MPRDWDASTYERLSAPLEAMGRDVLWRLELEGDETVLDAGCGSGRLTRLLAERLPHGRLLACDAAPSMVERAREALPGAEVFQADLGALELAEPVDAIFSNAVFHWIRDHDALFERLFAALRPGGRLVAQCGGQGNLERFHSYLADLAGEEPFSRHLAGWRGPWRFSTPREAAASLRRAGFADVECWLEPRELYPPEPREFLRVVCLGPHQERLPDELRGAFVDAVLARRTGPLLLDYVRLNIDAGRPG
jgi:trans-aconitate 2-methyltransferase